MKELKGVRVSIHPNAGILCNIRDIVYNRNGWTNTSEEEKIECLVSLVTEHGDKAFSLGIDFNE